MKKFHQRLFLFISCIVLGGLMTAAFFYWKNLQQQQYNNLEISAEQDQFKIAEDQADLLDTVASTTKDQRLSEKKYHIRFGILMYHHINNKDGRLSVSPENFDAQIKYLIDNDYKFVKLSDAFKTFASSVSSSPYDKTLALTFDDAPRDFYTNAYPVLKKYNVPAVLYVINQDIGKRGSVTWDMLKQFDNEGLVEIGVHTMNHVRLVGLKPQAAYYQMAKSKELLEAGLNTKIETTAYPFGSFDKDVEKQAKGIGFVGAVSVYFGDRPSGHDLYSWRRMMVNNTDIGPLLLRKLYITFELIK